MKKLTKKQMIATGAIVILGVGGISAGVISHNNTVHAQQVAKTKAHNAKVKADKKAKDEQLAKEEAQQKQVTLLLDKATKNPSADSIKVVKEAIAKLSNESEQSKDLKFVSAINDRLALIQKAQAAVKDYQAHATDANKQKAAQSAINALTDKNDTSVKAQLQKLFNESNKQAQEAAKAVQSKQQTSQATKTADVTGSSNQQSSQTSQENSSNASNSSTSSNATPSYSGGGTNTNTGNNSNSNGSNSGSNNSNNGNNTPTPSPSPTPNPTPAPTPQPTVKYMGWVSVDGVVKYSQNFDTDAQATAYASSLSSSKEMIDLGFEGHSIRWGVRPVQV